MSQSQSTKNDRQEPSKAQKRRGGRPTKAEAASIEANILTAAWDAFTTQGFEGTTMEDVAERAGVTRMTIYLRYPNKIALLRATASDRAKRWNSPSGVKNLMQGDTLEEKLANFGRSIILRINDEEVVASRRLVDGIGEAAQAAREFDAALREPVKAELSAEIARHAALDGDIPGDPREIALLFVGMLEAIWKVAPEADPEILAEKVAKVVAILMRGRSEW